MTVDPWWTLIGILVTVGGSIAAAVVTGRSSAKSSPYGELAKRVVVLEERVTALEAERDGLREEKALLIAERDELRQQLHRERVENRAYITALVAAVRGNLPLPSPPWWFTADAID